MNISRSSDSDIAGPSTSRDTVEHNLDISSDSYSNSSMGPPPIKKHIKSKPFSKKWLCDPSLGTWVKQVNEDRYKVQCIACDAILVAGRSQLIKHSKTNTHKLNMSILSKKGKLQKVMTKEDLTEKKLIIDCDAGVDDALALIILIAAHKQKQVQIKAITCVTGNTTVDNVVKNVFRTLDVCKATDIPVYQGAYAPLLSTENVEKATQDKYHGTDGFGDVYNTKVDISKLQKDHAVYGLNKIVSGNPNEIDVICLGPLTNIALAIRMYPEFANNVKRLYIMGGNTTALGNVTPQAEFNFYMDPESVHIVFNCSKKPSWLLPWETCLKSRISHEWRKNVLGKIDQPCMQLMNDIEYGCQKTSKKQFSNYIMCDAILAGIFLKPEIGQNIVEYHADIELNGNRTRGQVVLDHLLYNVPNVFLIQDFDSESFKELLISSVNTNYNTLNL